MPLKAGRASKQVRLDSLSEVTAAAGVYLAAPGIEDAMPGGLLKVVHPCRGRARCGASSRARASRSRRSR